MTSAEAPSIETRDHVLCPRVTLVPQAATDLWSRSYQICADLFPTARIPESPDSPKSRFVFCLETMANVVFPLLLLVVCLSAPIQLSGQQQTSGSGIGQPTGGPDTSQPSVLGQVSPNYVLRIGDQLTIRALEMEEISSQTYQVGPDGFVDLPTLGRVRASDLSVRELEELLKNMLLPFVRQPQVNISVVRVASEPVFFSGAFRSPGVYPLQGRRTLLEMLSIVGGLTPVASTRVSIRRRIEFGRLPVTGAQDSPDGRFSAAEISLESLRDPLSPDSDIVLQPFDVIQAERSELVYVIGAGAAALPLDERNSISVTKALTLAGGLGPNSKLKDAVILRPVLDTSRRAPIPIDIAGIIDGREPDYPLLPNDVLYVPQMRPWLNPNSQSLIQLGLGFTNILWWFAR